jgi:hypothetical protein
VISAEAAYQSAAFGLYGALTCLTDPNGCISGYSTTAPTFIDSTMSSGTPKSGYARSFYGGSGVTHPVVSNGVAGYAYVATPMNQDQTGVRGFAGDHSGRICVTLDGSAPTAAASLPTTCTDLQ